MSVSQILAIIYVKLHATAEMTPEQIANLYDKAVTEISNRKQE